MKIKFISAISALLLLFGNAAFAATELCLALDGSGSISPGNFTTLKEGTATAVEDPAVVPQNSTVVISVVQFSSGSQIEVVPTVIDSQITADAVAGIIRAIPQLQAGTDIASAIDLCTAQFAFGAGDTQVIDVVTDGVSFTNPVPSADAAVAAGVDSINALGIGLGVSVPDLEAFVRPQPANDLGDGPGFVVLVPTFEDFVPAIAEKIEQELGGGETVPVPTLSQWAILLMVLLMGGLAATRIGRQRI